MSSRSRFVAHTATALLLTVTALALLCLVLVVQRVHAQAERRIYLALVGHNAGGSVATPPVATVAPSATASATATPPVATVAPSATASATATPPVATVAPSVTPSATATPPVATVAPSATATPQPLEGQQRVVAAEILRLVNLERERVGCIRLTPDPSLTLAAERHSEDMAVRNFFSHIAPDPRRNIYHRTSSAGYGSQDVNENLTIDLNGDAVLIVQAWMNSPAHQGTMLRCRFTEAGVGVYYQFNDEPNVQGITFATGQRIPFNAEGFSVDESGNKIRGPYYWYITLDVGNPNFLSKTVSGKSASL